ncbi:MAG TPA: NAD(P)/FAD-dependent oxidoreductase, partial [Phenylobacterium sp.]|nr:NAD(P)/FAD-dependent oxidoreductase [Phenylobacterium sp.]
GAKIATALRPDRTGEALAARLGAGRAGDSLSNRLRKSLRLSPLEIALLREGHGPALPREPLALAGAIKALPLRLSASRGLERAISSAGGVTLASLDARWMLKARPGVFLAGEMLDWEAPTGGYLLQARFAAGGAAARGATDWRAERA